MGSPPINNHPTSLPKLLVRKSFFHIIIFAAVTAEIPMYVITNNIDSSSSMRVLCHSLHYPQSFSSSSSFMHGKCGVMGNRWTYFHDRALGGEDPLQVELPSGLYLFHLVSALLMAASLAFVLDLW